jgi:deoxyribonuclease I
MYTPRPILAHLPCAPALLALLFCLLAACGKDPEETATPDMRVTPDMGETSELPESPDAAPDAQVDGDMPVVDMPDEDMSTPDGVFPARISTTGASFETFLKPNQRVEIPVDAVTGDRVTIWLRRRDGVMWLPAVQLFRDTQRLVYHLPSASADAHIPYQDDAATIARGWAFTMSGEHRLQLENRSPDLVGPLEFELVCQAGPCLGPESDRDMDGVVDSIDNCPDMANAGQEDRDRDGIGDACDPTDNDPYEGLSNEALKTAIRANREHSGLGYDRARDVMYGTVDNYNDSVECVYTGTVLAHTAGSTGTPAGFNAEHTWPQSQGASTEPARSDLHHLYPTTAGSNNRRSNLPFCEVVTSTWEEGGSKLGKDSAGNSCFEPRDAHKGNVARSLFYFSVVYEYPISASYEATLRQWNLQDPPDAKDLERNTRIEAAQRSRNIFVDRPELIARIADF